MSLLKRGSRGNDVVTLQRCLGLPQDGIFGPDTERGVINFQKKNGLKPDGIVGKMTWEKLMQSNNIKSNNNNKAIKAAEYAKENAKSKSTGFCAKFVSDALLKAGFKFTKQPSAYMYHSKGILEDLGFEQIRKSTPQKGDIYVEDKTKTHEHGHIAIFDGKNWISDFVQKTDCVHATDSGTNYYYRYCK